jgi:hypothetical protein
LFSSSACVRVSLTVIVATRNSCRSASTPMWARTINRGETAGTKNDV